MWSPFLPKTSTPILPERGSSLAGSPEPKVAFRPPTLAEAAVVTEPFERVGPRLRTMEFFTRELSP